MSRDLTQYADRVYMAEIEKELQRDRSTIRTWDDRGWLPATLAFHRDAAGWRYWTKAQLAEAKIWLQGRRTLGPGHRKPKKNKNKQRSA